MNRPWMPLDVPDYLADTGHLSTLEHGAYMLLIMHYWQKNGLPDDDAKLARIARMPLADWLLIRDTLSDLFLPGWKHKRVDKEIAHAEDIIGKRRAAADQRHGKSNANAEHKDTPKKVRVIGESSKPQSEKVGAKATDEQFERLWLACPKRKGGNYQKPARERFERFVRDGADPEKIIAAAGRWKIREQELGNEGSKYVAMVEVWLNKREWEDVAIEPVQAARPPPPGDFIEFDSTRWHEIAGEFRREGQIMPAAIYTLNGKRGAYVVRARRQMGDAA